MPNQVHRHKYISYPLQQLFPFNRIIKILILGDIFVFSGWGLIMPVLAVFIIKDIEGGNAAVAGMAIGAYWVVKSLLQIPIGWYLDRNHGEKDDYWAIIIGLSISALSPLFFLGATQPWHLYAIQGLHALGMAMVIPAWGGIFTRHVDKGTEAEAWGTDSSALGLSIGVAGIIGGYVAKVFGFAPLFVGVSLLGLMGVLVLLSVRRDIIPQQKTISFPKKEAEHIR